MNVLWSRYKYPINLIMDVTKAESYEVLLENVSEIKTRNSVYRVA